MLDTFVRTAETPLSDGGLWGTSAELYGSPFLKTNGTQALSAGGFAISAWLAGFALPIEVYVTGAVLDVGSNGLYVNWFTTSDGATPSGYTLHVLDTSWTLAQRTRRRGESVHGNGVRSRRRNTGRPSQWTLPATVVLATGVGHTVDDVIGALQTLGLAVQ